MGIVRNTKRSKISGDVFVMDFSQPSTLGFRTRAAKNLALLRLRSHSPSPSDAADAESFHYLQLQNRRLEKPQSLVESRKQPKQLRQHVVDGESRNPKTKIAPEKSDSDCNFKEASNRENKLDCESGNRITRDSKVHIPCSSEIEEFFEYAEQKQKTHFTEKYNFDIFADYPLSGRYE